MSDVIRQAIAQYGKPQFEEMMAEAGRIKSEYLQQGGEPTDVISPERLEHGMEGGGVEGLLDTPPEQRPDGTIAAPYVPTDIAMENGLIEPAAHMAVTRALLDGVNTVSSGTNPDGSGFAIGRAPSGEVVKVVE